MPLVNLDDLFPPSSVESSGSDEKLEHVVFLGESRQKVTVEAREEGLTEELLKKVSKVTGVPVRFLRLTAFTAPGYGDDTDEQTTWKLLPLDTRYSQTKQYASSDTDKGNTSTTGDEVDGDGTARTSGPRGRKQLKFHLTQVLKKTDWVSVLTETQQLLVADGTLANLPADEEISSGGDEEQDEGYYSSSSSGGTSSSSVVSDDPETAAAKQEDAEWSYIASLWFPETEKGDVAQVLAAMGRDEKSASRTRNDSTSMKGRTMNTRSARAGSRGATATEDRSDFPHQRMRSNPREEAARRKKEELTVTSVNAPDMNGWTLMGLACARGLPKLLTYVLETLASVELVNLSLRVEETCSFLRSSSSIFADGDAIEEEEVEQEREKGFLKSPAQERPRTSNLKRNQDTPEMKIRQRWRNLPPLLAAIRYNPSDASSAEVVAILLDQGFDVNPNVREGVRSDGYTPLLLAIKKAKWQTAAVLLQNERIDVNCILEQEVPAARTAAGTTVENKGREEGAVEPSTLVEGSSLRSQEAALVGGDLVDQDVVKKAEIILVPKIMKKNTKIRTRWPLGYFSKRWRELLKPEAEGERQFLAKLVAHPLISPDLVPSAKSKEDKNKKTRRSKSPPPLDGEKIFEQPKPKRIPTWCSSVMEAPPHGQNALISACRSGNVVFVEIFLTHCLPEKVYPKKKVYTVFLHDICMQLQQHNRLALHLQMRNTTCNASIHRPKGKHVSNEARMPLRHERGCLSCAFCKNTLYDCNSNTFFIAQIDARDQPARRLRTLCGL
ncbi:unnamed protein product [Amoebophrya sp. A120]|nr:unnamed protein product [Amoebophrya sp. A120]|eukprot:GSA120T00001347001.1